MYLGIGGSGRGRRDGGKGEKGGVARGKEKGWGESKEGKKERKGGKVPAANSLCLAAEYVDYHIRL